MIRVGIMGPGYIAQRVAQGIHYANGAQLYAVGSRSIEKARAFQKRNQIPMAYGSYEELLGDDQVDMVYICTPNALHFEHITMALQCGKHVLCEKPLVADSRQLQACFALARAQKCFLMEAEKTLFTPLNQKLKQLVEDDAIGELYYIEGSYSYENEIIKTQNEHWSFSRACGGSVFDVGVYPICYANWFSGGSITQIQAVCNRVHRDYDVFTQALITYDSGVVASVRSGWRQWMDNRGVLYGSKGIIETKNFWKNTEAVLKRDGVCKKLAVDMASDFTGEVEHAVTCIEQGLLESPILGEAQSLEIMKVLEYVKTI